MTQLYLQIGLFRFCMRLLYAIAGREDACDSTGENSLLMTQEARFLSLIGCCLVLNFRALLTTNQRALLGSLHLRGGSLKLGQTPGDWNL